MIPYLYTVPTLIGCCSKVITVLVCFKRENLAKSKENLAGKEAAEKSKEYRRE